MQTRSQKLTFVGYACGSKAYRFLDKRTNKITISRDAKFLEVGSTVQEELQLNESNKQLKVQQSKRKADIANRIVKPRDTTIKPTKTVVLEEDDDHQREEVQIDFSFEKEKADSITEDSEFEGFDETVYFDDECFGMEELFQEPVIELDNIRRSQRSNQGQLPSHYDEFVVGVVLTSEREPQNFSEAVGCTNKNQWIRAMDGGRA
ncbi:uncharacterized protein LOC134204922 [Armigeres subalbatus]|uniref:uncharacterized protein LOC134204922 n=1 Tax=Armigeres subalbatus TaxID=124917 RepID=UPI002ED6896A